MDFKIPGHKQSKKIYLYRVIDSLKFATETGLGKVAKKIVPFSGVSSLRGGRGSAGIQIDIKFFYDLFFCWNVPEMI